MKTRHECSTHATVRSPETQGQQYSITELHCKRVIQRCTWQIIYSRCIMRNRGGVLTVCTSTR
ncbi:hypothetical protein WN48_01385 [Eufriesea mexicana]|uniref:Uncharacterized protein n=1 Tax=Eufriesea mexicana TaxID=516756 RepID=A0A310SGG3_9HYME|nr:hypothetical protein WN48_01385 [Eufriesea mexicana]